MKAPATTKTTMPAIHAKGISPISASAPLAPVKFHASAVAVAVSTWSIIIPVVASNAMEITIIAIPAVIVSDISTIFWFHLLETFSVNKVYIVTFYKVNVTGEDKHRKNA